MGITGGVAEEEGHIVQVLHRLEKVERCDRER